jgi:hypothetical protein
MSLAARLQQLFQERRGDERERVLIVAHLRMGSRVERSVLLNLSRTGAMMAAVTAPEIGDTVTLVCEGLEAPAKVVWTKGYQFGLSFNRALDTRQVAAIVELAGGKGAGR